MNKKICFTSNCIGNSRFLNRNKNFTKNEDCDYLYFTDLETNDEINSIWEIIKIDRNEFNGLCDIKISRYFKFMAHKYIREKLGRDYEFIYYFDSGYYPNPNANWNKLCNKIIDQELGIFQYLHRRRNNIYDELIAISTYNIDTQENISKTIKYLKNINKNVNLQQNILFLNNRIGFYIKSKDVTDFCEKFWDYYLKCPTFRDQPLWSFLHFINNKKVLFANNGKFSDYFLL